MTDPRSYVLYPIDGTVLTITLYGGKVNANVDKVTHTAKNKKILQSVPEQLQYAFLASQRHPAQTIPSNAGTREV
jgi:hypothetical protein